MGLFVLKTRQCFTNVYTISIYDWCWNSNYTVRPRKKRKHINQVNFSENYDLSQKKFTLLQNSVYPLSFDTSYKMYWSCMAEHEQFQMVMSKLICAELEVKGLTGSATFQNKGMCWKDILLAFLLSLLSCFFLPRLLIFWHGAASLNLVISTQHYYSAQIDFGMHEFELFLFSHALWYHHVFGIKWKKRNALDNEA